MNKKGIELSINFLVMLIIALVVFGMGIVLFTRFFQEAENIKTNLDEQTRRELEAKMMSSSEQIVIYPTSLTIRKGKADIVGVGILNLDDSGDFTIKTEYKNCYDREGNSIDDNCILLNELNEEYPPLGFIETRDKIKIDTNKRDIISVPLKVLTGAASAKYSLLITVKQEDTEISKNLIYVTVP